MEIIFVAMAGIALVSGFMELTVLGIPVTYLCMMLMLLNYVYEVTCRKQLKIRLKNYETIWLILIVYALAIVLLSFSENLRIGNSGRLLVNAGYIFRQAYYILFLPAVILVEDSASKWNCYEFMKRNSRILFVLIAVSNAVANKEIAIGVPVVFALAFLSLLNFRFRVLDVLMAVLVLCSPVAVGGEMTNKLIRLVYAAVLVCGKKWKPLLQLMIVGIWGCVGLCLAMPLLLEFAQGFMDVNTLWRARFWTDELKVLAETGFLGVGYGTSYTSLEMVNPATYIPTHLGEPFSPTSQYSIYDKVFVTGPHNSFVSLVFRLGIVGLAMFICFLIILQKKQMDHFEEVSLGSVFAVCVGIIIITLNVGLESPVYMLIFLFAVCCANYEVGRVCDRSENICPGTENRQRISIRIKMPDIFVKLGKYKCEM